jgi:hypothetical protein
MDANEANKESNRQKQLAGQNLDKLIVSKLESLIEEGVIIGFEQDQNFSHKDFQYKSQFLANFVIKTSDLKYIIVRSSNSFRSDRVKIPFYDLDGVLKHSNISNQIIASVFLVPDEEVKNTTFISTREKFKNKIYYSPATHFLLLSEFIQFLENYSYDIVQKQKPDEELLEESEQIMNEVRESASQRGSYFGVQGNKFEKEIETLLSDPSNLDKMRINRLPDDSTYKMILDGILKTNKIDINRLSSVRATNAVPLLKNGGNPKSDLIVNISLINGTEITETISLKNTTADWVSCHDYRSKDFSRVMLCEGERLGVYFNHFQEYPSQKDFVQYLKDDQTVEEFTELLLNRKEIFSEWVVTGAHDNENLIDPNCQVSRFMLIRHNGELKFYSMKDFLKTIFKRENKTFGLPFQWTYPSKQRGKRIQLKVSVKN